MTRLLLVLWLWAGAAYALPANTWVVTIGNNHGDPGEIGLRYAEDDARAFSDVLRRLAGVRSERIVRLEGEHADAVRSTLARLRSDMAQASGASALVVYYSGHSDAGALHLDGTKLALTELIDTMKALPVQTRLLVLDACRSGEATRVKGVVAAQTFELDFVEATAVEGLAVMTSSTAREASLESDRLRGSFFTHYLVGGLSGAADGDADGSVTLDEAYRYAYQETVRASGRTQSLQHPTFAMDMKGKGAVVLTRLASGAGRMGQLRLAEPALYLLSDHDGRLKAELNPERADVTVAVPAGKYQVQQRNAREYLSYDLDLRAGQSIALADLPAQATRYDRLVRKGGLEAIGVHGLAVMGGVRTEVVDGEGPGAHLLVEYSLDTHWLTPTVRVRGAKRQVPGGEFGLDRTHTELGFGLTLQRFVDLRHISLSFGVLGEAGWHQQGYDGQDVPDRSTWSGTFGVLFGVERVLYEGLSMRVEGGPQATVLRTSRIESGAEVERTTETHAAGFLLAGVRWRL